MGKSKDLASGAAYQDQTESDTRYVNVTGDTMTGELIARRARSNTSGDTAITVHPSDTTVSYGLRIDQNTNSLNFDRVSNNTTLMSISANGYVTNTLQPAFNATQGTSINISGTVTLTYNSVRSNASNSFNGSTGIFTAPLSGQYIFTHKALYYPFSTTEYLDFYSYVNSSIRNRYEQTGNAGEHTQVNYAEVVYLNANDTFKIVCSNRNIGAFTMYGAENHFSGRLLG